MIPKRPYGKSGEMLSIIGFGGIVVMNGEPAVNARVVADAVEAGVNYFDVAPGYLNAEEMLGPALEPWRDRVFLACKSDRRDAKGAREQLEQSLRRLRTGHFDLYQLHAITDLEKDVAVAFGPGGAMETFVKAREEGLVRHLGFSAHSPAAALKAMELFDFDSILYPINLTCHYKSKFDQEPLRVAHAKGMGIFALKAMARGPWDSGSDAGRPRGLPQVLVRALHHARRRAGRPALHAGPARRHRRAAARRRASAAPRAVGGAADRSGALRRRRGGEEGRRTVADLRLTPARARRPSGLWHGRLRDGWVDGSDGTDGTDRAVMAGRLRGGRKNNFQLISCADSCGCRA